VVTLVAFVVAVVAAPRWPAMGSKYDAPATRAEAGTAEPVTEQEMWRALDDGRDPTA
jgi:cytochrome c-type biogenesis protein CcmH/NrfG